MSNETVHPAANTELLQFSSWEEEKRHIVNNYETIIDLLKRKISRLEACIPSESVEAIKSFEGDQHRLLNKMCLDSIAEDGIKTIEDKNLILDYLDAEALIRSDKK